MYDDRKSVHEECPIWIFGTNKPAVVVTHYANNAAKSTNCDDSESRQSQATENEADGHARTSSQNEFELNGRFDYSNAGKFGGMKIFGWRVQNGDKIEKWSNEKRYEQYLLLPRNFPALRENIEFWIIA